MTGQTRARSCGCDLSFFLPAFLLSIFLVGVSFCFESPMNGAGYLQSSGIVSNPDSLQESHGNGVTDKAKTE